MPFTCRLNRDNNDIPLRSGQGENYLFVNLNLYVDRCRGIEVAHTLIVNKLNLFGQNINESILANDNFLSQMIVLQPSLLLTTAR